MRKVYNECFVFHGVFCKNIREIPAKYEIQKLYSCPNEVPAEVIWLRVNLLFLYTVIIMKMLLACLSKFEICAIIHYFTGIGNTATEIYPKLVPFYSDKATYLMVNR